MTRQHHRIILVAIALVTSIVVARRVLFEAGARDDVALAPDSSSPEASFKDAPRIEPIESSKDASATERVATEAASAPRLEPATIAARERCKVRGTILSNGAGCPGARVEFGSTLDSSKPRASTTTSADGRFELQDLEPGRDFEIRATAGDDDFARRDVYRLEPGAICDVGPIELERGARLGGVVVDPAGSALASAKVSIDDLLLEARTDAAGRFEFRRVPAGHHDLRAAVHGLSDRDGLFVDIAPGEQKIDLRIELVRAVILHGLVLDEARRPIAGVEIAAVVRTREGDEDTREWTTSNADGAFVFDRLASRECRIEAKKAGYCNAWTNAGTTERESAATDPSSKLNEETIEIVMKRGQRIHGRCVDAATLAPVLLESAEFRMIDVMNADRRYPREAAIDIHPDGTFDATVEPLRKDLAVRVRCLAPDRAPATSASLFLDPAAVGDAVVEVKIEFEANDGLAVEVKGFDSHAAVEAAQVEVFAPAIRPGRPYSNFDSPLASVRTGADGVASFSNLGAGSRRVAVRAIGFTPTVIDVTTIPGQIVRAPVTLHVGGTIEATVKDETGRGVAGIGVDGLSLDGFDVQGFTGEDGVVVFSHLPSGRYEVHAERSDELTGSIISVRIPGLAQDAEFRHVVSDSAITRVALVIDTRKGGSLEGTLTLDGKPLALAMVLARPLVVDDGASYVAVLNTTSAEDGRFVFPSIPPRSYFLTVVVADAVEYAGGEVAVVPGGKETTAIAITTANVSGRVIDAKTSQPTKDVVVIARYLPDDPRHAMTNYTWTSVVVADDGTFELKNVQVGTNEFLVRGKGVEESSQKLEVKAAGAKDVVLVAKRS